MEDRIGDRFCGHREYATDKTMAWEGGRRDI